MTSTGAAGDRCGVVVIGRNEGARLVACLAALESVGATIVYVDSGSTDGSVEAAEDAGAHVVQLDLRQPFTAARARNAGLAQFGLGQVKHESTQTKSPEFIQLIDGDCTIDQNWIATAVRFLDENADVGVVSGRLRERYPEASPYNGLCDAEWDTPIGQAEACGGIALMRWAALADTSLFDPKMIAGEEPELCLRLRRAGWKVWRIPAEMAQHDAAMTHFSQFWKRMRRGGFAFALWADMHGSGPEKMGVKATRRTLLWGFALPLAIIFAVILFGAYGLLLALAYPAQVIRLANRFGGFREGWRNAALLTIGKFAETHGILEFHWRKLMGQQAKIIEHK